MSGASPKLPSTKKAPVITKSTKKPQKSPKNVKKPQSKAVAVVKPTRKPRKMGRPTRYTNALSERICAKLAMGESMRTVCAGETMPSMSTVFKWLRERQDFSQQYARAKQESADAMAEDILDIADNGSNDWMERQYGDQVEWVTNGEALQRSRLRVDTRKFLMAKMKPKVYGDTLKVDGEIDHTVTVKTVSYAESLVLTNKKVIDVASKEEE